MYLKPLHNTFTAFSKELGKLYYKGISYWKIPLFYNAELLEAVRNMISADIIAQRLVGTPLRRD